MMKTEQEIREQLEVMKKIEENSGQVVNYQPAMLVLEWILGEGDKNNQAFFFDLVKKNAEHYIKNA